MSKMAFLVRPVAPLAVLFLFGAASCEEGQRFVPDGGSKDGSSGGHAGGGTAGGGGAGTDGTGGVGGTGGDTGSSGSGGVDGGVAGQAGGTGGTSPACPLLDNPVGGSVAAPSLAFGSTATYTCATNYALSPSGAAGLRTCQADGSWSLPVPTCADVCTVTGVGSASRCCNNGNCPMATPICNGSHACVSKALGATCSAGTGECGSNPCVNGICCQTTCGGKCDTGNCTGAGATCAHKPARTACGTIVGTQPTVNMSDPTDHGNDTTLICDTSGQCKGPTVQCTPGAGGTCDTTTNFCCNRSDGMGGGVLGCAPTVCATGGVQDQFGESCNVTSDCPTGNVCCVVGGMGYEWLICRPSCDQFQTCSASSPCPGVQMCVGSIYQAQYCE
jgi:hypothetical protein